MNDDGDALADALRAALLRFQNIQANARSQDKDRQFVIIAATGEREIKEALARANNLQGLE
jgi:hypothetical protein